VLVNQTDQERHPDDAEIEKYSLGVLDEVAAGELEQHVLICHDCQDRVAEMDAEIQGMRAAAREIRAQEVRKQSSGGSL
jgi:anti-sigma factor ChrR (cupin superfamily)